MYKWCSFIAFAAAAILIGCGGGGSSVGGTNGATNGGSNGGTNGGNGGGSGALSVFLTDSYESEHDHVWVTVRKIDIVGASGRTTVYRDDVGKQLDLKSLRDASGARFAFVSSGLVASQTYSEAEITLSKDLGVVPAGTSQTMLKQFSNSIDDGAGQVKVKARLTPRNLGAGSQELVLDFDLKNFGIDDGGNVIPKVIEGSRSGLDDMARHESEDYHGTVANLTGTAPNLRFDLVSSFGTIQVATSSTTVAFNSAGITSPSIQVGRKVEVGGVFVTGQRLLNASSIKIEDSSSSDDPHEVTGQPSQVNVANGTFTVAVHAAQGFLPPAAEISVQVADTTLFRTETGVMTDKATFFSRLATAARVEVEGTMDGNVFRAKKAKLDDSPGHAREAEAKGIASAVNALGGSLTLTLSEFEGFLPGGATLAVKIIDTTVFKNSTREAFFAEASAGKRIKVKGTYADGVLTAQFAEVSGGGGSNGGDDGGTTGGSSGSTTGGDDGGTTGGSSGSTTGGDDGGTTNGSSGGDDGGHNSGGGSNG